MCVCVCVCVRVRADKYLRHIFKYTDVKFIVSNKNQRESIFDIFIMHISVNIGLYIIRSKIAIFRIVIM